jgi:hypothetical protein
VDKDVAATWDRVARALAAEEWLPGFRWALQAGANWLTLLWASALIWSLAWLLAAWRLIYWYRRVPQCGGGRFRA